MIRSLVFGLGAAVTLGYVAGIAFDRFAPPAGVIHHRCNPSDALALTREAIGGLANNPTLWQMDFFPIEGDCQFRVQGTFVSDDELRHYVADVGEKVEFVVLE